MVDEVAALRAEVERLAAALAQLSADREHYRDLYLAAIEKCRKLELGIIGPKSEKLGASDAQLSIALLSAMLGKDAPPVLAERHAIPEHTRAKPTGRRPLPDSLPRVEVEILPPEVQAEGLAKFERIGAEVAETVERRPASMVVVRVTRPKFVRKDRERNAETEVSVAPPPELPIERGLAGPGLLADTVVRRWQDHLPLHRLEQVYAREGVELARSTICGWHDALAALARPLVDEMWSDARGSPYLCTDATGVLVQAKDECTTGHFWVVVAPGRHVLYAYTPRHDAAAVDELLAGYEGYLVADAHAVYDHLYKTGKVFEVGCWAHVRRYFYKALDSDLPRARVALALIGELFRIERQVRDASPPERLRVRKRESAPLVDKLLAWADHEAPNVLEQTPIAKGLGYLRNQRVALARFLDDGRLPVHNNASENALRREVVGRKNWLFLGSDEAGEVNTTFVTLLASCQLHGIEPWSYLRDVFCLLPSWPRRRVLELAPVHWQQTREQPDTQQLLAANVFRRAVLELEPHRPPG